MGPGAARERALRMPTRSVGAGGGSHGLTGASLFDRRSQARGYCLEHLKVVSSEGILTGAVEGQHGGDSGAAFERYRQSGTQRAVLRGIIEISGFYRGITVQDGFVILGYPARQTFPKRDPQRGKQAEVLAADKFRRQKIVLTKVNRHGVVRHKTLQPRRNQ